MVAVSVIVPVYNVEDYLEECLDSVLNQTFGDYEIICVDDGSTDSSGKILSRYAKADPRVKIVTQENRGLSGARNVGLDIASGEYVYFLDSDDKLRSDALEKLVRVAKAEKLDQVVFSASVFVDGAGSPELRKRVAVFERYYSLQDELCGKVLRGEDLFSKTVTSDKFLASVPLRFTRLSVLRESGLRFPEGVLHEDNYFSPICMCLCARVMLLNERFFLRRLRENSIMTAKDNSAERFQGLAQVVGGLSRNPVWAQVSDEARLALLSFTRSLAMAASWLCEKRDDEWALGVAREIQGDEADISVPLATYEFIDLLRLYRSEVAAGKSKAKQINDLKKRIVECEVKAQTYKALCLRAANETLPVAQESVGARRVKAKAGNTLKRIKRLKKKVGNLRRSESYRVGLAVTWPARRAYRMLKCYRENGFLYTIRRLFLGKGRGRRGKGRGHKRS